MTTHLSGKRVPADPGRAERNRRTVQFLMLKNQPELWRVITREARNAARVTPRARSRS